MNDRGDEQTASNAAAATKSQALMQFHATDEDDATRREAPGATAPAIVQSENALQRAFERELEDRMTEALDAGEFVIHLQPKLDLRKGQIAGAEALVRWRDPRVGLRLPGAFLPLFEKNGFIVDLDRFVFEQVCALLHAWSVAGVHPVPVSVNLSRTNLLDLTFLQGFERIRELYGVLPSFLEFELAEAFVFEDPGRSSRPSTGCIVRDTRVPWTTSAAAAGLSRSWKDSKSTRSSSTARSSAGPTSTPPVRRAWWRPS